MKPAYNPASEEIFHVAGDKDTGITTTADMTAGSTKVQLRYSGKWGNYVLTVDLYQAGNEMSVVLICPRCHHSIRVDSSRKQIDWDPNKGLFVEASQCTWELGDRNNERMGYGIGLCRFTFAIDGSEVRDS